MADPVSLALSIAVNVGLRLLFPAKIKGPRQEFSAPTGVPEGTPVSEVYGDGMVTGQLIWAGKYSNGKYFREDEDEEGGKGQDITTYRYFVTAAFALCRTEHLPGGKIEGIRRVWVNNKLEYDATTDLTDTINVKLKYGITIPLTVKNDRFAQKATFFTGEETQRPSSVIESFDGVGNVPAYRGLAYIVLDDYEVTKTGAMPQIRAEVVAGGQTSTITLYTPKTYKTITGYAVIPPQGPKWTSRAWGYTGQTPGGQTFPYATIDDARWPDHDQVIFKSVNSIHDDTLLLPKTFLGVGGILNIGPPNAFYDWNPPWSSMLEGVVYRTQYGGGFAFWVREPLTNFADDFNNYIFDTDVSGSVGLPNARGYRTIVCQVRRELTEGCYGTCSVVDPSDGGLGETVLPDSSNYCVSLSGTIRPNIAEVPKNGSYKQLQIDDISGDYVNCDHPAFEPTCTDYYSLYNESDIPGEIKKRAIGPVLASGDADDTQAFWESAYADAVAAGDMASGLVYNTDYPVAVTDVCQPPDLTEVNVGSGILLKTIITSDCERAGLDPSELAFDSGFDSLYVLGRMAVGESPSERISRLRELYHFDVADYDRKLNFVTRGLAAPIAVPCSEFGCRIEGGEIIEPIQRAGPNQTELHKKITVNYFDIDATMEQSKQTALRTTVSAKGEQVISSPVVFDATGAKERADIALQAEWAEVYGRYEFQLSDQWSHLVPSDWITTTTDSGRTLVFRLTESQAGANALIEFKASEDRAANYVANVYGAASAPAGVASSDIRGPTILRLLNLPNLDDSHDTPGVYVFVAGVTDGWAGALVEQSIDNQASWQEIAAIDKNGGGLIGKLSYGIEAGQHVYTEGVDTLTIALSNTGTSLSDVSAADFYNNRNMIALCFNGECELIGWRSHTDNGDGTVTLNALLRGLYGTAVMDWNAGTEVLFMYASAVHFVASSVGAIGKTYHYRATSFGTSADYSPVQSFAQTGESSVERPVVNIVGTRDGSSNLTVTFSPVGRLYDDFDWINSPNHQGFEFDVLDNVSERNVLRTISSATAGFNYSAADQTTDFGSAQSSIAIEFYAINALTGRGRVAEAIV